MLITSIERGVYIGVNTGESEPLAGKAADVETTININYRPDVERLVQRLEEGEGDQLTLAEIGVLAQEGKLDADDLNAIEGTGLKLPFDSSENPLKRKRMVLKQRMRNRSGKLLIST